MPAKQPPLGRNRDINESLLIGEDESENHFSPQPGLRSSDLTSGPGTEYRMSTIAKPEV